MNLKQKRLAFLEETAAHFNSNNRGLANRGWGSPCSYVYGCAIGRHIKSLPIKRKLEEEGSLGMMGQDTFNKLIPRELKALGKSFLERIQDLHDGAGYWDESGLSEKGKKEMECIKKEFNLNPVKKLKNKPC